MRSAILKLPAFRARGAKGAAMMIMVVVVSGIVSVLLYSYGQITLNAERRTSNIIVSSNAYYIAEAGIEDALLRNFRDNFNTDSGSPYNLNGTLAAGDTSISISSDTQEIESDSDSAGRKRKIRIKSGVDDVFTFAAIVGDGGLHMAKGAKIYCGALSCAGENTPGDLGAVYVSGDILANGVLGDDKNQDLAVDSKIAGNVYATGKVDIQPGESNEPDNDDNFVCLGASQGACTYNAQSIVQKIMIHNDLGGTNDVMRAAMRIAYHGDPAQIKTTYFVFVKPVGGKPTNKEYVGLKTGSSYIFAKFKIDTDYDGNSEEISADVPEWVYFNFSGNGVGGVNEGGFVYLVLQAEGLDANNYWKVYYDKTAGHGGSLGGFLENNKVCPSPTTVGSLCNNASTGVDAATSGNNTLDKKDASATAGADFHFRLYDLGATEKKYINSLLVLGELHADEAIGASVDNSGSIAFVGRRFASAFWKNYPGIHTLVGDSFVQQLDNCDISAASGSDTSSDLEYARGFRYFCDSNVRNVVAGTDLSGETDRHTINSYNVYTSFYDNPYRAGGSINYGDSNLYTPYDFNMLARSPQMSGWAWPQKRGCGVYSGTTYYINDASFASPPYNFCMYKSGATDVKKDTETDFKTMLSSSYSIPDSEQDNYLPKAPPELKSGWPPISNASVDYLANGVIQDAGGKDVNDLTLCDAADTISSTPSPWASSKCYNGDLTISGSGTVVTLKNDINLYVSGDLIMTGGSKIQMDGTPGEWGYSTRALVIVKGHISATGGSRIMGGDSANYQYVLAISRSADTGDLDPNQYTEDTAAVYLDGNNDNTSFYAPYGSVVIARGSGNKVMQVMAKKLVMRKDTEIKYGYGLIDLVDKDTNGPAKAYGISTYEEK